MTSSVPGLWPQEVKEGRVVGTQKARSKIQCILGTPRHIGSETICKYCAQVKAEQRRDAVGMATSLFQVTARDTTTLERGKQERNAISAHDTSTPQALRAPCLEDTELRDLNPGALIERGEVSGPRSPSTMKASGGPISPISHLEFRNSSLPFKTQTSQRSPRKLNQEADDGKPPHR